MPKGHRLSLGALHLLKELGLKGAVAHPVLISSREAGALLGVSQQMAANYLLDLTHRGYVKRALGARKQHVTITREGLGVLRREYADLKQIFGATGCLRLSGAVVSGVGEGRYYLSKDGYVRQFETQLGYTPFPGTLNVKLSGEALLTVEEIRVLGGVRIEGFEAEGRTFGGVTCYAARLNGEECHLIVPDRTHYEDVLEFIASRNLRKVLALADGDRVAMELLR